MNKTALITGASRRIGKAMALHLAAQGWNIVIHYNTSKGEALELSSTLSEKYPKQEFPVIKADLMYEGEVEKLIPAALKAVVSIGLLVNNASVFDKGSIEGSNMGLYNSQFQVNLKAPFILTRDFAKLCKKGSIINMVDTRVTQNKSNYAAYSLSKKGLWELTKMAALEFSPEIRVNAIAPGVSLAPEEEDESYLLKLAEEIPMKKPGGAAPILKSLDYILENDFLTGQLLFADGGENLGS